MKKSYTTPELEVVKFTLIDVLSGSPTDTVSEQGDTPVLPGDESELDGDGL